MKISLAWLNDFVELDEDIEQISHTLTMSGLEVSERSPQALASLVDNAYFKVMEHRRPEAVANMLKVIAATLEEAQSRGESKLGENSVRQFPNL